MTSSKNLGIKNFLSILLTVALCIQIVPITVFAQSRSETDTESTVSATSDSIAEAEVPTPEILAEEVSLREENVKHFRMSDGTVQAVQYAEPVHYEQDGVWLDYDNSLDEVDADEEENAGKLLKSKDLVNRSADYSVRLSKKTNGKKFVRLEKDGYKLSWYYLDADKRSAEVIEQADDGNLTTLENVISRVVYADVFKATDLEYILHADGIKENLLLQSEKAPTTFTAEYKVNGLTPIQKDAQTIELQATDGTVIYVLTAPYMTDAAGAVSEDITLSLTSQKNDTFTLQLALDKQWLHEKNRAYPVTVDPAIQTKQETDKMTSTFVDSGHPNTAHGAAQDDLGSMYVGHNIYSFGSARTYIKVNELPDIGGIGSKVIDARLSVCKRNVNSTSDEVRVNVYPVTSSWSASTLTYNNQPSHNGNAVDYMLFAADNKVQSDYHDNYGYSEFKTVEITDLVRGWYENTSTNYGVMLDTEAINTHKVWFFSIEYTTYPVTRPVLTVTYRNMSGYEDYWSYTSIAAGRGGTASVNNFNGNFIFAQPITQDDGGNLMPVNLSVVFNANKEDAPISYIGSRMQTNYHIYVRYDATNAANGYRYYLNDADGTKHWFYFEEGNTTKGEDEDGLGYTLEVITVGSDSNEPAANFRLKDKDENTMYFNTNGRLVRIRSASGLSSTVQYETVSGYTRIKSVTDGAGRVYTFVYQPDNAVLVTAITDPAGRSTQFSYYQGGLTYITFADGEFVRMIYDYNSYVIKEIRGIDNTRLKINYDNSGQKRVTSVNWGASDDQLLESYSFSYKQNETKITDIQNRSYTYQFNDYGQTTGVVSNTDGTAQFFELEQGNDPGNAKANKLLSESRVIKSVTNFAVNPGFTRALSDGYGTYIESASGGTVTLDSGMKNITNNAVKITKPAGNAGRANAVQYIDGLAAGTYTFSGFVHTNGAEIPGEGASLFAEVWNAANTGLISSNWAEAVSKTDGWQRQSVTFTVPEGGRVRLLVGLHNNASGTVWYDDLQLEKGENASTYNIVENSGFTNGMTSWKSEGGADGTRTWAGLSGFDYCGKLPGTVEDRYKNLLQIIPVSGNAGDVFSFGMWAWGSSAPLENGTKDDDSYEPRFEIVLHYYDKNGLWAGYEHLDCNPDLKDAWQFVSCEAIIPKDYGKIGISLIYNHNVNNAYLTGAFCYKEQYGQTYTYDDNGNVVSAVDLAETNSSFAYYGNQMAQMLNPSGSKYLYSYNEKKQLVSAVSTDGQEYGFTYDDNSNVTKAEITARKPATELQSGQEYILVNAYSGLSMSNGKNTLRELPTTYVYSPNADNHHWRLVQKTGESDLYHLQAMGNPDANLYLDVQHGQNIHGTPLQLYTFHGRTEQTFKIVKQEDGTFVLLTAASNYTKCVDGQVNTGTEIELSQSVKQANYDANKPSAGQKWYFYPVEKSIDKTIVTEAEYTESGNFPASVTDQLGNETTYSYNEQKGTLNSTTDALGRTTSYTYDANNNALLSVSAGGMTNSYAYSDDRLQTITVNSSLQYALAYDVLGRTTSTKVGNGTSWRTLSSLSYNSAGLLAKQTYGNGDYIDFTYDSLDRITEKRYNGSSTKRATYAYGADGSLARTTDFSTGTTTRYVYDLADRLVSVREYDGTSVTSNALRSSTDYIYADKTNYLTGMCHFSPLGTQTVDYTYGDITKGQMPDQVYSVKWNGEEKLSYTYDPLGRLSTRTLHVTGNVESIPQLTTQYSYVNVGEDRTTTMVQSVSTMGVTHNYTYDAVGNIQSIQLGSDVTSYEYDSLNQLVRVNDPYLNRTITYEYENGNITFEHTYAYTTGDLPATPMYSTQYHYNDPVWRDVLTGSSYLRYNQNTANAASAYSADAAAVADTAAALAESLLGSSYHEVEPTGNSLFAGTLSASAFGAQTASAQTNSSAVVESTSSVQSDEIGNIIDVDGMEFVWEGRQLQSIGANGTPFFSYEYNIDGQRTKKTVTDFDTGETTTTEYFYNGSTLAGQKTGSDVLVFMYDESGDMFGFTYNGTPYYYVKNAQNDVWAVTNADGQAVVLYFYDAWGDVTRSYEADGYEAIAEVNPILYRSYYCDLELGFYYLNTRYYVPAIHRFLCADSYVQTGQSMLDKNMFAYCLNDPVNGTDANGDLAIFGIVISAAVLYKIAMTAVAVVCVAAAVLLSQPQVRQGISTGIGNAIDGASDAIDSAVSRTKTAISKARERSKEKEKDVVIEQPSPPPQGTVIYRYGGTNPGNLTPKEKDRFSGLSFSTIPRPGAAMTTIEALNATGVVYAVQDGATHVSVRPVGATVDTWIEAGSNSIWTQAVGSVVVKWDGEN